MALIGQHQQTSFSNPQNGQSPIDATVVRTNDNATATKHNAHDADATVHVQTGLLSARPAAGTAGAMYMDENARLYRDNGASWGEVPYARLAASSNTFTGNVAINGSLAVDGATALAATQVTTLDATGNATVGGTLGVTGAVTAPSYNGAATGLTGIPAEQLTGTLPAINGNAVTNLNAANLSGTLGAISGANLTNLNATNLSSGTVSDARLPGTMTAKTIASVVVTGSGTTVIGAGTGNFLNLDASATAGYVASGVNLISSLDNCPVATGGNTLWLRCQINGDLVYIPCVR